ncbi:MAG: ABC transporter ATP-binding protein [Bacteroidales bacterium]
MKIQIKDIEFSYNSTPVLNNITTNIEGGDMVALVGPNGSGKSTLIKCLNKILIPQKGAIFIDDKLIDNLPSVELAKKMAYVPQNENKSIGVNVFDMVLTGRKPYINWKPSKKDLDITAKIINTLQIQDIAMKDVNKLSGGQQQMVYMARALAQQPGILLLDEPTANLDIKHQLEIMELLKGFSKQGIIIIIALHDINMAIRYASKFIMLKEGNIFATGGKEVLSEENIESLYNVKVHLIRESNRIFIIPNGLHGK